MRYKIGDKVRVRGDLEDSKIYGGIEFLSDMEKNKIFDVLSVSENGVCELNDESELYYSPEMLRPAEFKIWCETEEEKGEVLKELEKEGYVWRSSREKPTDPTYIGFFGKEPSGLYIQDDELAWNNHKQNFGKRNMPEFTPSEFTGIDFSEKIIISKTPTGATVTYGDKTVTTEGDFDDAARQALAEVLCPFKVGDKVRDRRCKNKGIVTKIRISGEVVVHLDDESGDYDMTFKTLELLEPYVEPSYNAKLFCIKDGYMGCFKQGHIYEVKDGKFTDFNSDIAKFKNLEEINSKSIAQFMEIKGGLDD